MDRISRGAFSAARVEVINGASTERQALERVANYFINVFKAPGLFAFVLIGRFTDSIGGTQGQPSQLATWPVSNKSSSPSVCASLSDHLLSQFEPKPELAPSDESETVKLERWSFF